MPRAGPRTVQRYTLECKLTAVRLTMSASPRRTHLSTESREHSPSGRCSRGALCCSSSRPWRQKAGDIFRACPKPEQRFKEQVGRDGSVGRLHLGHPRLTRPEALSRFALGQAQLLTAATQAVSQGQLDVNKPAFLGRQAKEVARVTHGPSGSFEFQAFVSAHHDLTDPSTMRSSWQAAPTAGIGREWGNPRLSPHWRRRSKNPASTLASAPNGGVFTSPRSQTTGLSRGLMGRNGMSDQTYHQGQYHSETVRCYFPGSLISFRILKK